MGFIDAEFSITLVNDAEMAELADRFGRPNRPTDVLAFPAREGPGAEFRGNCLGDVVLSIETSERQSRQRNVSLSEELETLMIHGVLHLLGMDHHRPAQAHAMRALESHLRWELDRA